MTKKLTRIMDEEMDLLLNHTTKLTNPLPLAEVVKFAIAVRTAQLAHCQEEHDQAVKEERQAAGELLERLPAHISLYPDVREIIVALLRGELPKGIKEEK